MRWCIAFCAASSACFAVVKCFGGLISACCGDGPRGLCGTVVALEGNCRGNWISFLLSTGLDLGAAAVSGGDILPLLCDIRESVSRAVNIAYVGAVVEKW